MDDIYCVNCGDQINHVERPARKMECGCVICEKCLINQLNRLKYMICNLHNIKSKKVIQELQQVGQLTLKEYKVELQEEITVRLQNIAQILSHQILQEKQNQLTHENHNANLRIRLQVIQDQILKEIKKFCQLQLNRYLIQFPKIQLDISKRLQNLISLQEQFNKISMIEENTIGQCKDKKQQLDQLQQNIRNVMQNNQNDFMKIPEDLQNILLKDLHESEIFKFQIEANFQQRKQYENRINILIHEKNEKLEEIQRNEEQIYQNNVKIDELKQEKRKLKQQIEQQDKQIYESQKTILRLEEQLQEIMQQNENLNKMLKEKMNFLQEQKEKLEQAQINQEMFQSLNMKLESAQRMIEKINYESNMGLIKIRNHTSSKQMTKYLRIQYSSSILQSVNLSANPLKFSVEIPNLQVV